MSLRKIFFLLCIFFISTSYGDTVFQDTQGKAVKLSTLNNKWIIVNYWASWCGACLEEIPELNNFYQHHGKNVLIYGVNFDGLQIADLKQAIQKTNIIFPVLEQDPNQAWRLGSVIYLPTTFIMNPEGKVVKKIVGPNTEESLLTAIYMLQKHPEYHNEIKN